MILVEISILIVAAVAIVALFIAPALRRRESDRYWHR